MQIRFCMACPMPLYPLRRKKKKKSRKLTNGLFDLQPAQEFWFCLLIHCVSTTEERELCRGESRHRNPEKAAGAVSEPSSPEHDGSAIQSYQNTKADWDFTVSTQNKWIRQKRSPCLCKQKSGSVLIRNGIVRNVSLPWDESPGCRGKMGQRSFSHFVLSSWQVENSIITKSHRCTQQKQFWPLWLGKKRLKVNHIVSKHYRM